MSFNYIILVYNRQLISINLVFYEVPCQLLCVSGCVILKTLAHMYVHNVVLFSWKFASSIKIINKEILQY